MQPASKATGGRGAGGRVEGTRELNVPDNSSAPHCRLSTAANQLMTRTERYHILTRGGFAVCWSQRHQRDSPRHLIFCAQYTAEPRDLSMFRASAAVKCFHEECTHARTHMQAINTSPKKRSRARRAPGFPQCHQVLFSSSKMKPICPRAFMPALCCHSVKINRNLCLWEKKKKTQKVRGASVPERSE